MPESPTTPPLQFKSLALIPPVLRALNDIGYETPSPIQERVIPHVIAGDDVVGQAQTGTGKTAAFALPLLSKLDLEERSPQALVLTPTRELAIQVAEAFQRYAAHLPGFHVAPIYGGQSYAVQLKKLKRGVHVVVGTPGRVMDHIKRNTLALDGLSTLVLDEADEMLRMGFIDDVEWILEQTPETRQIALFSATMPKAIRRIAQRYLNDPVEVTIKVKTTTAETIRQRYWCGRRDDKVDALCRILEAEPCDGVLIFVRTKTATVDLATRLEARGFSCSPINGDIPQAQRERTVDALRDGRLDIVVGTDVAARGLDVDRISHVINFDIPCDTETYVHRIGRTGRAGRNGDAILLIAPRERRLLHAIEQATRQKIEQMRLPSTELLNAQRIARFKQRIDDVLDHSDRELYTQLLSDYQTEKAISMLDIAAALATLAQGDTALLVDDLPELDDQRPARKRRDSPASSREREPFRIEVGRTHGVNAGAIVGAIANESGLSGKQIGRIKILDHYSVVDLPADMPTDTLKALAHVRVMGRPLKIARHTRKANHRGKSTSPRRKSGDRPRRSS